MSSTAEGATVTADPPWLDRDVYPFDSRYVDLPPGRLHYVDEGTGPTLLFLHGNPTWSFLYRELIAALSEDYRCVAPDSFGFGLSAKPADWSYRPADHAAVVSAFVDRLGLRDLTLVVQDWGGAIGGSYAVDHPENVRALVVMNAIMWPADDWALTLFGRLVGGRLGRVLIRRYNLFAERLMPVAIADASRFPPAVHDHYRGPLAAPADRRGCWTFPREILGSGDWLADRWDRREALAGTPALVLWGMRDAVIRERQLRRWQELFPDARTVEYADAGHYLPEEKGAALAVEVDGFLRALAP